MPPEEIKLNLLNRFFEEAVCLHGGDWKKVLGYVKGRIEALAPGDRAAIDGAFKRLSTFHAPDFRGGPPH